MLMCRSRNCWTSSICLLFVFCGAWTAGNIVSAADNWKAGVAVGNITPKTPMWMSGYGGRDKPAEGKLTELWAKSLVIEDAQGHRLLLITMDLVGISRQLADEICNQLKAKHGLHREQIAICTSHTHTGPVVLGNLTPLHYLQIDEAQQRLVKAYARTLVATTVETAGRAIKDLRNAELSWGNGRATFAVNRRNNTESKVPELRKEGKLVGPVDHDAPVLAVRSGGELRAIVFGYACHATVLSFYQWSGDYPGFAQMELEKQHPGAVALFFAGCGADQNPLPRRKVELAKQYGKHLADSVTKAIKDGLKPLEPNATSKFKNIPLRLGKIPSRETIESESKSKNKWIAARAKMFLEQMDGGAKLPTTYEFPVQTWKLGEVQFVTLGGEVVVDFAVRLKSELQGTKTWVAGYSNDVMAYIASRRVLREGGYEGATAMVYYGLPTKWHESSEDDIVNEVHRQLKD